MVTRTLYQIPAPPNNEGREQWKSWDSNDKEQQRAAQRELMIHAKTLERRLNDPDFMKVVRQHFPKGVDDEYKRDFGNNIQNMIVDRPYEFEPRLRAIWDQRKDPEYAPILPTGAEARPYSSNLVPSFAEFSGDEEGAIKFAKEHGLSEQEAQDIWDEEFKKLEKAYQEEDYIFQGAIAQHGQYVDESGYDNPKAREIVTSKATSEFLKKTMAKTHPGWSSEEITAFVDTPGHPPPERLKDQFAPGHDRQLIAINKRLADNEQPDYFEAADFVPDSPPTSVLAHTVKKGWEQFNDTPEEERKYTEDWFPDWSEAPELYWQALAGEDAAHGWPGLAQGLGIATKSRAIPAGAISQSSLKLMQDRVKAKQDYEQGIRYKYDQTAPGQTMQYKISPEQHAAEAQAAEQVRAAEEARKETARQAATAANRSGRSETYRDYVPSFLRFESVDPASSEMIVEQIKKAIMKEFYQGSQSREGARMPINLFKQDRHITYNSDPFDVFSFEFEQVFNSLVAKYNFAIEDEHLHEPVFHEAGRVIQSFVDVDSIERKVPPQVYDENTTLDTIMSEFQNLFAELLATHSEAIEEENLGDDVYREALGLVKARLGLV